MKRLTEERVARLYRHKYWDAVKADELPDGVDYLVFDFAVNAGPGRAIKLLQSVVGVPEDGAIGPKTLKAVESITPATVIQTYTEAKEEFYRSLNAFKVYGKGWLARTDTAEKTAYTLLG